MRGTRGQQGRDQELEGRGCQGVAGEATICQSCREAGQQGPEAGPLGLVVAALVIWREPGRRNTEEKSPDSSTWE